MAKIQMMRDGHVVQEFVLRRGRITIGRRRNSDIQLDHPAVSGDHALIERIGRDVYLEDRDSTNGTRLNGKRLTKRQKLRFGDEIMLAQYRLRYCDDDAPAQPGFEQTLMMTEVRAGGGLVDTRPALDSPRPAPPPQTAGMLRILSGPNAGREMRLTKALTTLGRAGVAVAEITRDAAGYHLRQTEGVSHIRVNGRVLGDQRHALREDDLVEFMGMHMIFSVDATGGQTCG